MNDNHPPPQDRTKPAVMIVALLLILLSCFSSTIRTLTFGWIPFLLRSLDRVTPRWDFLLVGILALGGLILSIHLLSQQHRQHHKLGWKFSLSLSIFLLLLFTSGTAIIGAAHHTIWIITDRPTRDSEIIDQESLSIPIISRARRDARTTQWLNQIRSVMLEIQVHATNRRGKLAAGGEFDENGNGLRSWSMQMLPGVLYADWNEDEDWKHPDNAYQCKCLLPDYVRPNTNPALLFDEEGYGLSELAGNVHVLGINKEISMEEITDGIANTILLGEVIERLRPWCDPANVRDPADGINQVPWGFGGEPYQKGAFFGFCDGSVKFLSESTDRTILKALATPTGAESVDF